MERIEIDARVERAPPGQYSSGTGIYPDSRLDPEVNPVARGLHEMAGFVENPLRLTGEEERVADRRGKGGTW